MHGLNIQHLEPAEELLEIGSVFAAAVQAGDRPGISYVITDPDLGIGMM